MRELGEATASLERSHDLETRLLKGNRTLQEQSVECEQPKEEYRWLREELNVTWATLPVQCDITIDTPTQTICSEPDGKETEDLAQLATLQAEHGQYVCKSRPSGSGHESFQILPRESQLGAQATLLAKALVSKTREWELLQLSAANMKPELKSSGDDLTTLQMEKTASRDKERVKMLSFQTELVKQLLAEK
ncbi:hypothetical protein EMCRGX_G011656 [Ephydatia muelleri]